MKIFFQFFNTKKWTEKTAESDFCYKKPECKKMCYKVFVLKINTKCATKMKISTKFCVLKFFCVKNVLQFFLLKINPKCYKNKNFKKIFVLKFFLEVFFKINTKCVRKLLKHNRPFANLFYF